MALEQSILKSTKKVLGLADDYTAFDHDVIVHINSVFADLHQLGIGPEAGYAIGDDGTELWTGYVTEDVPFALVQSLKSYMYLRVKHLFDPPGTGALKDAAEAQIQKWEWRITNAAEAFRHPLSEFTEESA